MINAKEKQTGTCQITCSDKQERSKNMENTRIKGLTILKNGQLLTMNDGSVLRTQICGSRMGKIVITSRHLRDRLYRELNTDVSLRVEDTDTTECFIKSQIEKKRSRKMQM